MPREFVTSQRIFDLETQNIFRSSWICVARIAEFQSSGVLPIVFEDQRLILIRSDDGSVRAFRNFCRHRGSLLVTADNCSNIGQRIQCPYHAWTYGRDGKLLAAPNMDGIAEFHKEDFGLIEVPCSTFGGFVWINGSPEQSLSDFLSPVQSQFDRWSLNELNVVAEFKYEVQANWKLIFQNYNECYHCPIVHPLLNRLTPYKDTSNDLESGPILGGPMSLSAESETMSTTGKAVGILLPLLDDRQARSVNYFTIFPTMFLSTHPDYVLIHLIQRVNIRRTKVTCQFLFHPESDSLHNFDPSPAVEFWDMTNQQDWKVCELAQAGMEDSSFIPGPYSNLESVLAAFDQHYLAQVNWRDSE